MSKLDISRSAGAAVPPIFRTVYTKRIIATNYHTINLDLVHIDWIKVAMRDKRVSRMHPDMAHAVVFIDGKRQVLLEIVLPDNKNDSTLTIAQPFNAGRSTK